MMMSQRTAATNRRRSVWPQRLRRRLFRFHNEVLEIARAVRLRPQADLSRYGLGERVFKGEIAVDVGFEISAGDRHLEFVPLVAGQVPRLPSRTAPNQPPAAVTERPQRDVVLGVVVAGCEPIAIGLNVE